MDLPSSVLEPGAPGRRTDLSKPHRNTNNENNRDLWHLCDCESPCEFQHSGIPMACVILGSESCSPTDHQWLIYFRTVLGCES